MEFNTKQHFILQYMLLSQTLVATMVATVKWEVFTTNTAPIKNTNTTTTIQ